MLTERVLAYAFVSTFVLKNAPERKATEVHISSGDGFFDQTMMLELGFINVQFLYDWFHVFDSGLSATFGKVGYEPFCLCRTMSTHVCLMQILHAFS